MLKPFVTNGLRYKQRTDNEKYKDYICTDHGEEDDECANKKSLELVLVKLFGKPPKEHIYPMMNKFYE